ncbi:MAG: hypothetical protein Q8M29_04925 [Bacteroidota bacterium]|nr:hypothetical protein [Bacteroidota bacterium]
MKKRIAIIKQQAGDEGKKALMVVLGFASGAFIAKGMDKLSEKFPEAEPYIKYAKPFLLSGGGFLISAATTKDEIVKYYGYGLATAGAFAGINLIPFAKDFIGFGSIEGGLGTTYYTESNLNSLEIGNFGINALPVKSFAVEDTPSFKVELPELEVSTENMLGNNLGYNGEATKNSDRFKGII